MAINLGEQKEELIKKTAASQPKTLTVGTQVVKINGLSCDYNNFRDQDGYDIILSLEGPDLGSSFEGFWIDKEDQSLGRHKGAVGTAKLSPFTFTTKTFPANGNKPAQTIERDTNILQEMTKLAKIFGKVNELLEGTVEDIPSLIAKASTVFAGSTARVTLGGREYLDKGGYTKYALNLVKPEKGFYAIEAVDAVPSKIQPFIQSKHIQAKKAGAAVVDDAFEPVEVEFSM